MLWRGPAAPLGGVAASGAGRANSALGRSPGCSFGLERPDVAVDGVDEPCLVIAVIQPGISLLLPRDHPLIAPQARTDHELMSAQRLQVIVQRCAVVVAQRFEPRQAVPEDEGLRI